MEVPISTIYATGGASANRAILQVMADVFGAEVYQLEVSNSAALGAALRAFHADSLADGRVLSWDEVIDEFVEPVAGSRVEPDPARHSMYQELMKVHAACEAHALGRGPDPTPLAAAFRERFAA
jgi:xylulokinase